MIFISLISLILLFFLSDKLIPYTYDSAAYISTAKNMLEGKGLQISRFSIYPINIDTQPLARWPPGYPLLIALLGLLKIEGSLAARILPGVFFILLPYGFF
ncbi:MAG: hypothetical protein PHQ96_07925, partial [Candidatus Omnitrophica bacterium]|nr:hypothetical protein [Candidatus Omnitrophota bacterium]